MTTRMRSPNYPSTSLPEAVELIDKIHRANRSNVIDREVAAQTMGYTGISGRSAKLLSNLVQYGLIEKAGKSEIRVTQRGVEILHPDDAASKLNALREAAFDPELFQRVRDRFPDGLPSEGALRSYLVKEGFTNAAIPSAMRAYMETCQFIEQVGAYDSHGHEPSRPSESVLDQRNSEGQTMILRPQTHSGGAMLPATHTLRARQPTETDEPAFSWQNKKIWLAGAIVTKQQAQDVINFVTAMMQFLPEETKLADDAESEETEKPDN